MYCELFQLTEPPFRLTPDPQFLFASKQHSRAKAYMESTIWLADGFVVITGDIGSGKTTLIEAFLAELPQDIVLAHISQTQLSPVEFLQALLVEFGFKPFRKRKVELLSMLKDFMVEQYAAGKKILLILDEAQNLSRKVLEEVRLLSGLELRKEKLLRIIIAGQPELSHKLDSPRLQQLTQRVRLRFHLGALSKRETHEYITHRLEIAGAKGRKIFEPEACDLVFRYAGGVPRLINVLCDTAMLCAFAEERTVVDDTLVKAAVEELQWGVSQDGATTAEVPVAAIAASLTFTPQEDGELTVAVDPAALQTALGEGLSAFGTPAKDADFQISGGAVTVVPSVDGTGVDPAKLAEQLLPVLTAPAPRSVTAELGPVPADFTTEEAQALGIKEEISSFTTRFTSPASGTNIRVVAGEVDGALVMPGETFSLNTFTGPRGTAQGYVEAAVIQNGELSKAVGGGISQFATTMFNAVFFAGLEDVFHKPHSFYISRYPAGREATVYEGAIDLQWRNDSDAGVYIDTTWVPGAITVTFYGTKRFEIEAIEGARRNPREPAYQEKVDDGDCTPQPGIPGFDISVTRVFRDLQTGAEIRRENFNTSYAAEAIIKCIPPSEPVPPAESPPGG